MSEKEQQVCPVVVHQVERLGEGEERLTLLVLNSVSYSYYFLQLHQSSAYE